MTATKRHGRSINDTTTWGPATGGAIRIAYCRDCCEPINRDNTEAEGVLVIDPADRFAGYVCRDCK